MQLDDNYTTAVSRGGKQFLSAWACVELIIWFSPFFLPLLLSAREGEGRDGLREHRGVSACSTRLRGKRLWGGEPQGWITGGKRALAMGHWARLIPYERSGRSRYCHANNGISFVATLVPACSFNCPPKTSCSPLPQCSAETINKSLFKKILMTVLFIYLSFYCVVYKMS